MQISTIAVFADLHRPERIALTDTWRACIYKTNIRARFATEFSGPNETLADTLETCTLNRPINENNRSIHIAKIHHGKYF